MFTKKPIIKTIRNLYLLAILVVFSLVSTAGNALSANSAEVSISASFERALVVQAGDPITFGNILTNTNAGSVSINKITSEITWSGGVVSVDQGNSKRGYINFIGPRPGNVGITYDSTVLLKHTQTAATVTFAPAAEVTSKNIANYNEDVKIYIGGTLTFGTNVTEGMYTGSVYY